MDWSHYTTTPRVPLGRIASTGGARIGLVSGGELGLGLGKGRECLCGYFWGSFSRYIYVNVQIYSFFISFIFLISYLHNM